MAWILDPFFRKRAGFSIQILENWAEIVGHDIAATTQPLRIIWSSHRPRVEQIFEPATLAVACNGFSAMVLQHKSAEVIQRVNTYFGYSAISRLKIEQKVVRAVKNKNMSLLQRNGCLNNEQRIYLEQMVAEIKDDALRQSLYNLGENILINRIRDDCEKT